VCVCQRERAHGGEAEREGYTERDNARDRERDREREIERKKDGMWGGGNSGRQLERVLSLTRE